MNKEIIRLLVLILTIASPWAKAGESKKCPKDSVVEDILKNVGVEINDIDCIGSMKMEDTYFHVFSGKKNDGNYLAIIFNNKQEYLGFYNTGSFEPDDCRKSPLAIYLHKDGERFKSISMSDDGPWEKVIISTTISPPGGPFERGEVLSFTQSKSYTAPKSISEPRNWKFGKDEKIINAKLARFDGKFVCLQALDTGAVRSFNINFLSSDDKKYLRQFK